MALSGSYDQLQLNNSIIIVKIPSENYFPIFSTYVNYIEIIPNYSFYLGKLLIKHNMAT